MPRLPNMRQSAYFGNSFAPSSNVSLALIRRRVALWTDGDLAGEDEGVARHDAGRDRSGEGHQAEQGEQAEAFDDEGDPDEGFEEADDRSQASQPDRDLLWIRKCVSHAS